MKWVQVNESELPQNPIFIHFGWEILVKSNIENAVRSGQYAKLSKIVPAPYSGMKIENNVCFDHRVIYV